MIMVRQPDSTVSRSAFAKSHILLGHLKACIFKPHTPLYVQFRGNAAIAQPVVIPAKIALYSPHQSGGRGAGVQECINQWLLIKKGLTFEVDSLRCCDNLDRLGYLG